jgi:hypothetical protein
MRGPSDRGSGLGAATAGLPRTEPHGAGGSHRLVCPSRSVPPRGLGPTVTPRRPLRGSEPPRYPRTPWLVGNITGEDFVHRCGPVLQHGPNLELMNQLGDSCLAVANQPGYVLNRHPAVGEQRHEAVPHPPRCPLASRHPSIVEHLPKELGDVSRVQLGSDRGREHQAVSCLPSRPWPSRSLSHLM